MAIEEIIEELKNLEFYNRLFDNSETVDRKTEAVVSAIKGLEELKRHREAWERVLDEMMNVSIPGQDAEYVYENIYDIIKKYRPKEGDAECPEKKR